MKRAYFFGRPVLSILALALTLPACAGLLLGVDEEESSGSMEDSAARAWPVDASAGHQVDGGRRALPDAEAPDDAGLCAAKLKLCGGQCVSALDPAFGCSASACGNACPAPAAHGAAVCSDARCAIQCDAGFHPEGGQCLPDLAVPPGAIGVRVDQARITSGEPLQLNVLVSNGTGGSPLALDLSTVSVKTSDGVLHAASVLARSKVWVDGADFSASNKLAEGSGFQWRIEVDDITRASGLVPVELRMSAADGRSAKAAITPEACTVCGAVCTYLDRDLSHCGACGTAPSGAQAMSCSGGVLKCEDMTRSSCATATSNKFACVDLNTDNANCGACGRTTQAGVSYCDAGAPKCSNGAPPVGGTCPQWRAVASGTTVALGAVAGTSATQVWTVGRAGTILAWNGTAWTSEQIDGAATTDLMALAVTSPTTAVAAGVECALGVFCTGKVLERGSASWSLKHSVSSTFLSAAWTTGPNADVWVGGENGRGARRSNAGGWTTAGDGTLTPSVATSHVLAGITRLPGEQWVATDTGTLHRLAVGQDFLQYDASSKPVRAAAVGAPGHAWFAGDAGEAYVWNGTVWRREAIGSSEVRALWFDPNDVGFASAADGAIYVRSGGTWRRMTSGTAASLNGIWGSSANDVWAVGNSGTILHYAY